MKNDNYGKLLDLHGNLHNINDKYVQISTTKQHTLIEPHLMPSIRGLGQRVEKSFYFCRSYTGCI